MKKRCIFNIFLISFALILVSAAGIGEAWAYFTTYAEAKGGYRIKLGYETEIEEKVSNWEKTVIISSKEGSQPIYIRAKAFCGADFELDYSGDKWTFEEDDGYWYYNDIVYGGGKTEPLKVKIINIPENVEDSFEFNVVVIYESTLVRYNEDGSPFADWSATLDSGRTEGGH